MRISRPHGRVTISQYSKESPRNIVVFGESGVGKSSLINLIIGRPIAATSNSAKGCTFQPEKYELQVDATPYMIWDTPGLDEGTYGTVPAKNAEETLRRLLHDLSRANGIHLLVYCVRASRLRKALLGNYNLFYSAIGHKKVPIVVVVTGLENYEGEMEDWWMANEAKFAALKMHFDGHACVTTLKADEVDSPVIQQRCNASREAILSVIAATCHDRGGADHGGRAPAALANVRTTSGSTRYNNAQPLPIIALYHLPERPLNPTPTASIRDTSPFEGARLMDVGGSLFLVYHIRDQHLHSGMRFKKQIALREADLLIACASVHHNPSTSLRAAAAFYESYGGDARPLLIVAKDALSDEEAHKWWKNHHRSDHPDLQAIVHALPPVESPAARAAAARVQQTIQTCSLRPVDVPPTGCFGWLACRRRSPMLYSANTDGITPVSQEDFLMDAGVWSLWHTYQL